MLRELFMGKKGDIYKLIVKEHEPQEWTWHLYSNLNKTTIIESPHKYKTSKDAKANFEKAMMRAFRWLSENHVEYLRVSVKSKNQ